MYISGYVNVPGRMSARPVVTRKHGAVMEVIEQRAFAGAISRSDNIKLLLDHEKELANTSDGTLLLKEDNVGLRAETVITDPETIRHAKELRGWSFEMRNIDDTVEKRADGLPIRHVKSFEMPEVSLILKKNPVYSSTSIELRAEQESESEYRAEEKRFEIEENTEDIPSYTEYEHRINAKRIIGR